MHAGLANRCICLLSHSLKRDICCLQKLGVLATEVPKSAIEKYISQHVQDACRYWVDHLEQIGCENRVRIGLCDDGQIHSFFVKHFLHWLEALSLVGKISEGVVLITRLESMIEVL